MSNPISQWIRETGDASLAYKQNLHSTEFTLQTIQMYVSNGFISSQIASILWNYFSDNSKSSRIGIIQLLQIATSKHPQKKEILLEIIQSELKSEKDSMQSILEKYNFTNNHYTRNLEEIPPSNEWEAYINSASSGPIQQVRLNYSEIELAYKNTPDDNLDTENFHTSTYQILLLAFPELAEMYKKSPENFAFRYFYGSQEREVNFGNYEENLQKHGVDLDIKTGWKGIWTRTSRIYGGKLKEPSEGSTLFLIVYVNVRQLLNGPGFYDEGALDFHRLVAEDQTLRDLLLNGCIIQIKEDKEENIEG